jgi:photosystem II stability/assembly factor-like uncharacterized protein
MPTTQHIDVSPGDAIVLVGTAKGAFLFRATPDRSRWEMGGPYFPGQSVYSMAYTGGRMWAATSSMHWGAVLCHSDDRGRTWTTPTTANIKFPEDTGLALKQIWQLAAGPGGVLYCGVEPASLFKSTDGGESWELVRGLHDHPHRTRWEPGGGGLCLHTIIPDQTDANRVTIAISTGGVYRTTDGGATWAAAGKGVRAEFMPDKYPEFGQCVHKMVSHPSQPRRLFLQNHWGLYRSDDGADSWQDIAQKGKQGPPSDFGFSMVQHPHEPATVYIVPLESDQFRAFPGGAMKVWRTRDAGETWQPLSKGLPQEGCFDLVLRDGAASDGLKPAGIYVGTRGGKVFGSADDGDSWRELADNLPAVLCVKAGVA